MPARHLLLVPVLAGLLLLAAGPAAVAKEEVSARLLGPARLDADPGERVTVEWALAWTDEHGRRRPFDATGVFVRLLSASGGRPTVGFATPTAHPQGRYAARVAVPEGGVGGVQVGLRGTSDGRPSDVLFPLERGPFAAPARGAATGRDATSGRPSPAWPALAGGLALLGLLAAAGWWARSAGRLGGQLGRR